MNQPSAKAAKAKKSKDRVVCFCYSVAESIIVQAIQNGCSSLMDIRRETYASTGCAGCSEEVKKLLKKHATKAEKAEKAESGTEGGSTPPQGKVSNG
jgi:NAD(P)H-nitrite reductase large subunit